MMFGKKKKKTDLYDYDRGRRDGEFAKDTEIIGLQYSLRAAVRDGDVLEAELNRQFEKVEEAHTKIEKLSTWVDNKAAIEASAEYSRGYRDACKDMKILLEDKA